MSLLRSLTARPAEQREWVNEDGRLADLLTARNAGRSASLTVTPTTALKHDGVNACVNLIAQLASWPTHAYKETDGRKIRTTDPNILRMPSVDRSPIEWRREVIVSWLTRGNAAGIVTAVEGAQPKNIELIPVESVSLKPKAGGAIRGWDFLVDGEPMERWPNGPLWWSRGLWTFPGIPVGISPIEMACGAIGLGLAAEDFGRSWFYDGAVPSAVLYSDQAIDETTAKTLKARFVEAISGKREPAVLGHGTKYEQVSVAADESQFLETLDRNLATVARFFLVSPENIGGSSGNSMTYSNIESRGLHLLQHTFGQWLAKWEETLTSLTTRPTFIKANPDALLRMDTKTRTQVLDTRVRNGTMSRNEVRRLEDEAPITGGDEYLWPPYRAFPIPSDEETP